MLEVRSFRIRKFSDMFRTMQGLNGPTRALNPYPNTNLNHFGSPFSQPGSMCAEHKAGGGSVRWEGGNKEGVEGQDRWCELMRESGQIGT